MLFPQVYHVRNKMDKVGLDMLLDIHGDEELPYNFINGNEVGIMDHVKHHAAVCFSPAAGTALAVSMHACAVPANVIHILRAPRAHEL